MSRNSSVKHKPEVNEGKLPIFFSEDSLHHTGCWLFIFVLFIISVITWQNDTKNLPIVSWNFFCELLVYVTCDTSNWSPELLGQKALIWKIVTSRQIDHQTGSWNKFADKAVKMVIFEFIMEKWSRDPLFGSINNADYHVLIFITKKILRNQKSRN